jgi:pyridoxamine 5'-phosphate oxidase family protein
VVRKGVTMSPFTEKEIQYLLGQRLGRLATAGADCSPHVMPVGFRVSEDGEVIEIGGHGLSTSKKWRDLKANSRVAFVVDDLESVNPWTPRGIEIRGRAELRREGGVERFGSGGWDAAWLRVVPRRIVSWGIEGPAFSEAGRSARSVGTS